MQSAEFSQQGRIYGLSIWQQGDSLIFEQSRRDGCTVGFLSLWLFGWTYGLVAIAASKPFSGESWNALVLMGVAELIAIGVFIYNLTGRERLILDRQCITWDRRAVIRLDHRVIAVAEIQVVDLLPLDPAASKEKAVGLLTIKSGDSEIRFGRGLVGDELHKLLAMVRGFVETVTKIAPAESAAQFPALSRLEFMEQELNKPQSAWAEFGSWLTVPFFVLVGFMMLVGGLGAIRSGHIIGIVFGLFFVGLGLLLTVGLMASTIIVFVGWLRRRRGPLEEPAKAVQAAVAGVAPEVASPQPSAVASAARTPEPSQPKMTPVTWLAVIGVLLGAALSFALRFQRAGDFGGSFFHVWASLVGAGVACGLLPRLRAMARVVAAFTLVAAVACLQMGSIRFAPQVLFPLLPVTACILGACYCWSKNRRGLAILLALALLPISSSVIFYSVPHMKEILRLTGLKDGDIVQARINLPEGGGERIISDRETLARLATALHDTVPYSPNHEGIKLARELRIELAGGDVIALRVGKGNRAHPNTVWMQLGVAVYQNPRLYPLLEEQSVFE